MYNVSIGTTHYIDEVSFVIEEVSFWEEDGESIGEMEISINGKESTTHTIWKFYDENPYIFLGINPEDDHYEFISLSDLTI